MKGGRMKTAGKMKQNNFRGFRTSKDFKELTRKAFAACRLIKKMALTTGNCGVCGEDEHQEGCPVPLALEVCKAVGDEEKEGTAT